MLLSQAHTLSHHHMLLLLAAYILSFATGLWAPWDGAQGFSQSFSLLSFTHCWILAVTLYAYAHLFEGPTIC